MLCSRESNFFSHISPVLLGIFINEKQKFVRELAQGGGGGGWGVGGGGGGGCGGGEGVGGVEGNQDWISIPLIQDEFQSVSHFLS